MKLEWQGNLIGVQPRIRLMRSFDQRQHSYLGYMLLVDGIMDGCMCQFSIGIGKGAQAKYQFRAGDRVQGVCEPVMNPEMEPADYYKASKLTVLSRGKPSTPPPWTDLAVDLETTRARGHRRLSAATYEKHCRPCRWGCRMAVEIIIDQWNPDKKRFRRETFCYGPKSCALYKAGAPSKVPGRRGMTWVEEDWIDEQETAHRGPDD
ncbi:hypothetical protein GF406_21510 [candidate division KSB1 bacterium]|nr:hypothetical protein [candidate division KSB1 bacterium]